MIEELQRATVSESADSSSRHRGQYKRRITCALRQAPQGHSRFQPSAVIAGVASVYSAPLFAATGSAPVTVVNTPLPVTVDAPLPVAVASDRTPFQALLCTPGCSGGGQNDPTTKVQVPAGARLVIEYVSIFCGRHVDFITVNTVVNGTALEHFPGVPVQVRTGGPFISAQTVRIYADPGTTVGAGQEVPVGQSLSACNMQLSGYTTPAP